MKPSVSAEFQGLIPPLTEEELSLLEVSIQREGCRDALVVWKGHDLLLDGHNRLDICEAHSIPYRTAEVDLPDRDAAKAWVIRNQLARRNLTTSQRITLAEQLRPMLEKDAKERMLAGTALDPTQDLAEGSDDRTVDAQIAEAAQISRETVRKHHVIQQEGLEADKQALRKGKTSIDKEYKKLRPHVHFSSATVECNTPADLLERVVAVLGAIDLDPCSDSSESPNVPAAHHYTRKDDGLSQEWAGRVFMNPPYGRVLPDWVEKLCESYESGAVTEAIVLVPSRTDTQWFLRLVAYPRCFITGRLVFSDAPAPAPFPSMAAYLGSRLPRFLRAFRPIGPIYGLIEHDGT